MSAPAAVHGEPTAASTSRTLRSRELGTLLGLLVMAGALWIATPHFMTASNLLNVLQQSATIGVLAVGMTFVILTGGIDLSVGSLVALTGIVLGALLHSGVSPLLAVTLSVCFGLALGAANGALITLGRLPPFIVTLGMMSIARGSALILSDGRPISGFTPGFRALATDSVIGLPIASLIMLALFAVAHFALTRTTFGRYVYAIGGNETAALLSGIRVRTIKTGVYAISGMVSAITALLLVARLDSAQPIAGINYELDAIAAVVIGGASLMGGSGSVTGTLVGTLIMATLRNGLNLLGVSSYLQQVAIGVVIIVAVLIDVVLRRRRTSVGSRRG